MILLGEKPARQLRRLRPLRGSSLGESYYRKLLAYVTGGGKANAFGRQLGITTFAC